MSKNVTADRSSLSSSTYPSDLFFPKFIVWSCFAPTSCKSKSWIQHPIYNVTPLLSPALHPFSYASPTIPFMSHYIASVWKVIPIVPCSTFMLQLLPLSLFSLISHPCCHDEGKEANCQTRLREELPSLVLPFNSWYNREEEEEEQRRGVKHERDEERFDRLPRSVTPRGTCPGYVSRWQALLCSCVCWCVCVCACSNSCGRPESSQLSVTGLQPRQLEGTILSLPTDLFLTLNVKLGLKRHLNNQISVKICTCKKQIALITIKRPSRLRSQPVLPRCKANSTLSVLKWRLHWCLHKSLTVKLNFTLLIHPPLSCISFMSRQSTAISICQLKMCVNEECVGALMMKLSPPAILNLGLNLRSVLYLLIKVVPKLG